MTAMSTTGLTQSFPPQAEVVEMVDQYLVELDVSDFAQEELQVVLEGDRVSIVGTQGEVEGEEPAFRLHERLEETFRLPGDADPSGVTALFEHGTLDLIVPKRPVFEPVTRAVPIRRRQHGLINPDATPS